MDEYSTQDLISNWLCKKNGNDQDTLKFIENCLNYFHLRRRLIAFHSLLFQACSEIDLDQNQIFIPNQILSSYGNFIIQSPFHCTLQIWKVFLKQKSFNTIFLQLFTAFLSHIKINDDSMPLSLSSDINDCLQQTKNLLASLNLLSIENEILLVNALNFCHAWGQLILMKYCFTTRVELTIPSFLKWFDISFIHDYHESFTWFKIFSKLKIDGDTNLLNGQVLILLLIQKVTVLAKAQSLQALDKNLQRHNILQVLKKIVFIFEHNPKLFGLINLSNIIFLIPVKLMQKLTTLLVDSILSFQDETILITLEDCRENQVFISSLLGSVIIMTKSLIKNHQSLESTLELLSADPFKWIKTSKKCCTTINEDFLLKFSVIFESFVKIQPLKLKNVQKILTVLKIVETIPLAYLFPLIQVRCIFFLSSLLLGAKLQPNTIQLQQFILKNLNVILGGVKSVWFFDFISPFTFLIKLSEHFVLETSLHQEYFKLISLLFNIIFKKSNIKEQTLDKIYQIVDNQLVSSSFAQIWIQVIILKQVNFQILKSQKLGLSLNENEDYQKIGSLLTNSLLTKLSLYQSEPSSSMNRVILESLVVIFDYYFQAQPESTNEVLFAKVCGQWIKYCIKHVRLSLTKDVDEVNVKLNFDFLSLLFRHRDVLKEFISEKLSLKVVKSIFPNFFQTLDHFSSVKLTENFHSFDFLLKVTQTKSLQSSTQYELNTFFETPISFSSQFFKACTGHQFDQFLKFILISMQNPSSQADLLKLIFFVKGLFSEDWSVNWHHNCIDYDQKLDEMNKFIDSFLFTLTLLCKRYGISKEPCFDSQIIVPLLSLVRLVINNGKCFLTTQKIFLAFQAVIYCPLINLIHSPLNFISTFNSIYFILNDILLHYQLASVSCLITLNSIIQSCFQALIFASNQDLFINYSQTDQVNLEICSSNMGKLITLLSQLKQDFEPFASSLISLYINSSQEVTIHNNVKRHLILSIYKILSLIESSQNNGLEMIHSKMNQSSREILKELHDNYQKYYIFKGRF